MAQRKRKSAMPTFVKGFDPKTLTIAEIEAVEEITGQSFAKFGKGDAPMGKMLRAMAYVSMKRKNPNFTIEDAGNIVLGFGAEAESDPTETSE